MSTATCVIYNPAAGRGKAEKLLAVLRHTLGSEVELRPTREPRHATELARNAATEGFARVVAAGGDGTVHEVANGILQSGRRDVVFSVWPIGSANDYAFALGMDNWWKKRHERPATEVLEVDVGRVVAGGRERFMVSSFGVGFNGMVTIEARKTQWIKGMPLYAWAFLKAMVRHFATPTTTIQFDDREVVTPTLALSVLNAQREGNFPLRPAASLTDGHFDFMHATKLNRGHLIRYLPAMATGNLPVKHRLIKLGRVQRVSIRSETPLCAHADGEFVCVPEEHIYEISLVLIPQALRVEVYRPALQPPR